MCQEIYIYDADKVDAAYGPLEDMVEDDGVRENDIFGQRVYIWYIYGKAHRMLDEEDLAVMEQMEPYLVAEWGHM